MTSIAADDPRGDYEELEGFFRGVFPFHVVYFGPPHLLTVIPIAGGVASAAAAQPRIAAAGGAASHDRKGIHRGSMRPDTGTLCKRCASLQTLG